MSNNTSDELTCNPIDTYSELMMFLKDPPPWRSLCQELTPHSEFKINNIDIHKHTDIFIDEPETFCHINPDADDPPRTEAKNLPKTLVCHDMANGYHDDSYVDGTGDRNAYTFYNWAGIDIFCYFSHHLITIPPLSWINVAHAHGVKVIGTLITEWNEGVKFWDEVLQSETMFQNTASALVAIAKSLKFDGWLLNIENKIAKPKLLLEFVQHLRYLLHQEIPHGELIWYDSVTVEGHLNWQNGLNDKNKAFFNACDGLFTNYSWTEFDITTSAIEAGDRLTDLYIGIDVWGRNFFGGGQLNTQAAIKVVHDEGCSLAIFAPAWTHEAMSIDKTDPNFISMAEELDPGQRFLLRDRALWGSFWPYLTTRLPSALPFKTSFCRGLGKKRRIYGEVISRSPWYNLRHQQYQPNSAHGPHGYVVSTEDVVLAISTQGMFKDVKGILRVRESFQASRVELFSLKPRPKSDEPHSESEDNEEEPHNETKSKKEEAQKSVKMAQIERNPMDRKSIDSTDQEPKMKGAFRQKPVRKRTFKECLKEFFRVKSQKKAGGGRVSVVGSDHPERESLSDSTSAVPKKISRNESEPAAGPSGTVVSSGKSMVAISVNLRLGQSSAGPCARVALAAVPLERECLEMYQEDSFVGGSCLRVHPADEVCRQHRYTRLLHCDFPVQNTLVACVVTKTLHDNPGQNLTVRLHTVSQSGASTHVVLVGRDVAQTAHAQAWAPGAGGVRTVMPLAAAAPAFRDLQRYLLLNETGFYVPVENYFGWVVRYYEVPQLGGSRVTSVNLRAGSEHGAVLLGHFGLCNKDSGAATSASTVVGTAAGAVASTDAVPGAAAGAVASTGTVPGATASAVASTGTAASAVASTGRAASAVASTGTAASAVTSTGRAASAVASTGTAASAVASTGRAPSTVASTGTGAVTGRASVASTGTAAGAGAATGKAPAASKP